jgi:hypothetical protein
MIHKLSPFRNILSGYHVDTSYFLKKLNVCEVFEQDLIPYTLLVHSMNGSKLVPIYRSYGRHISVVDDRGLNTTEMLSFQMV